MMTAQPFGPADFPRYFKELWGREPFPWQIRLLDQVVESGWPDALDLPTASGKTAILDIAVFALALDAGCPPAERRAPLRTVFVIDRRVVVDQAFRRADSIAKKLAKAEEGILAEVAAALRRLQQAGDRSHPVGAHEPGNVETEPKKQAPLPLMASILRGGMPRESDWARTPTQPVILVSTVDQVGSRLLFRGYGVTDSMRPVHAGLLGEDVLYVLDEVHLSRAFEDTLTVIKNRYASRAANAVSEVPHRFEVVRLSATPRSSTGTVFRLDDRDREHTDLSRRIRASKLAVLQTVNAPKNEEKAREALAAACVANARKLMEKDGVEVTAIIVNRVDTARLVAKLAEQEAERCGWSVQLLTGRMRALDRREVLRRIEPDVTVGRERGSGRRVLLVSTQAIEAGADFDFDALVTECASLDALRQRFGRLDRLGELGVTHAVIVAASSQIGEMGEELPSDAVYGEALARTWHWLLERAEQTDAGPTIDFGVSAMEKHLVSLDERLFAPSVAAPLLLPVHVDLFAQTCPRPAVEPDVALFLHGSQHQSAEVQVVWRADVEASWLDAVASGDEEATVWTRFLVELVGTCPPSTLETIAVPINAARAWLSRVAARRQGEMRETPEDRARPVVSDVEGEATDEPPRYERLAPVFVWRGEQSEVTADPDALKPGDTLVLPSGYGGIRKDNWDPEATDPVFDRGDEAQLLHRGRAIIRWHPEVVKGWCPGAGAPEVTAAEVEEYGVEAERWAFARWAADVLEKLPPDSWARVALEAILSSERRSRILRTSVPGGRDDEKALRASLAPRRVPPSQLRSLWIRDLESEIEPALVEAATEDDLGSFSGEEVLLETHLQAVARLAGDFARSAGLGESLVDDIVLAASIHDIGKADPRFQLMLHGGDEVRRAVATGLLAKSAIPAADQASRVRARRLAGYPRGARHEVMSAALASEAPALRERATDWDLVLHLVASHHGYCRPFAPPVPDLEPVDVEIVVHGQQLRGSTAHGLARLDSDVADRYWRLVRRYGWWRLAWMEAILRLADHRASEAHGGE